MIKGARGSRAKEKAESTHAEESRTYGKGARAQRSGRERIEIASERIGVRDAPKVLKDSDHLKKHEQKQKTTGTLTGGGTSRKLRRGGTARLRFL